MDNNKTDNIAILFPRYNINIILISGRDPYYEYSEIEYSEK